MATILGFLVSCSITAVMCGHWQLALYLTYIIVSDDKMPRLQIGVIFCLTFYVMSIPSMVWVVVIDAHGTVQLFH